MTLRGPEFGQGSSPRVNPGAEFQTGFRPKRGGWFFGSILTDQWSPNFGRGGRISAAAARPPWPGGVDFWFCVLKDTAV